MVKYCCAFRLYRVTQQGLYRVTQQGLYRVTQQRLYRVTQQIIQGDATGIIQVTQQAVDTAFIVLNIEGQVTCLYTCHVTYVVVESVAGKTVECIK